MYLIFILVLVLVLLPKTARLQFFVWGVFGLVEWFVCRNPQAKNNSQATTVITVEVEWCKYDAVRAFSTPATAIVTTRPVSATSELFQIFFLVSALATKDKYPQW